MTAFLTLQLDFYSDEAPVMIQTADQFRSLFHCFSCRGTFAAELNARTFLKRMESLHRGSPEFLEFISSLRLRECSGEATGTDTKKRMNTPLELDNE